MGGNHARVAEQEPPAFDGVRLWLVATDFGSADVGELFVGPHIVAGIQHGEQVVGVTLRCCWDVVLGGNSRKDHRQHTGGVVVHAGCVAKPGEVVEEAGETRKSCGVDIALCVHQALDGQFIENKNNDRDRIAHARRLLQNPVGSDDQPRSR